MRLLLDLQDLLGSFWKISKTYHRKHAQNTIIHLIQFILKSLKARNTMKFSLLAIVPTLVSSPTMITNPDIIKWHGFMKCLTWKITWRWSVHVYFQLAQTLTYRDRYNNLNVQSVLIEQNHIIIDKQICLKSMYAYIKLNIEHKIYENDQLTLNRRFLKL